MKNIVKSLITSLFVLCVNPLYGTQAPPSTPNASGSPIQEQKLGPEPINPSGTEPSQYRDRSQASREYHLKGAFLRYVAKFVIFPPEVLKGSTINLCVLGQVPVFQGINSINGKIVNERTIAVSKILNVGEAKTHNCQIVYVAKTETDQIKAIIDALKNEPILGFGDMDSFAQSGGEMNFYIANNHLAIMTNLPAVEAAKLSIDPQMLKLVTFVPKA